MKRKTDIWEVSVVDWLNGKHDDWAQSFSPEELDRSRDRLLRLRKLVIDVMDLREISDSCAGYAITCQTIERELNGLLERYPSRLRWDFRRGHHPLSPGDRFREVGLGDSLSQEESAIAHLIVNLGNDGVLHRIRPCQRCGRWLYARRRDDKSCSRACRQALYDRKRKENLTQRLIRAAAGGAGSRTGNRNREESMLKAVNKQAIKLGMKPKTKRWITTHRGEIDAEIQRRSEAATNSV